MDRTAQVIEATDAYRRHLWASLPWSIRLADFFMRMADSTTDSFGTGIYIEFLKHGIAGMPPIGSVPAEQYDPKHTKVPSNYGREFGTRAYKTALAMLRNPGLVEDFLMDFYVRFRTKKSEGLKHGMSLQQAQRFVMNDLEWQINNLLKSRGRRKETPTDQPDDDDEGGGGIQIPQAHSVEEMARRYADILVREIHDPKVKSELERIHPDAVRFIELMLDGKTEVEILGRDAHGTELRGGPMLKHPQTSGGAPLQPQNWKPYKAKIFDVIKKHLPDLTHGLGQHQHHTVYAYKREASYKRAV